MTFNQYSKYYNLLYQDKDYQGEVDYIVGLIKKYAPKAHTVLELGCGTGRHAKIFSQYGFELEGIDLSQTMIEEALKNGIKCHVADVKKFRANKTFDIVLSLFHVVNYQTKNSDLTEYFKTACEHLPQGGVFIFDTWWGPAVLAQKPEKRFKRMENIELILERTAVPLHHINENIIDVNYDVKIINKNDNKEYFVKETHSMRYLFKPEIELFMNLAGFEVNSFEQWLSSKTPCEDTWSVCVIGVKK